MPESSGSKRRDYSKFDGMSTEMLEDILRADSQLPDGENSDMDAILYIMEVIARREKENTTGKYTNVDYAWKSFGENYLPYTEDEKALFDFEDNEEQSGIRQTPIIQTTRSPRKRRLMRVACIAAVITTILLGGTITASALGIDLWSAVAKWTRDTFGFSSSVSDAPTPDGSIAYKSLQDALDSYSITAKLAPTWLPDGYALKNIKVNSTPAQTDIMAAYKGNDSIITITVTLLTSPQNHKYEKDENNVTVYSVNETDYYIMSNIDRTNIAWQTENYECSISGKYSIDEAKTIIDSIYERITT